MAGARPLPASPRRGFFPPWGLRSTQNGVCSVAGKGDQRQAGAQCSVGLSQAAWTVNSGASPAGSVGRRTVSTHRHWGREGRSKGTGVPWLALLAWACLAKTPTRQRGGGRGQHPGHPSSTDLRRDLMETANSSAPGLGTRSPLAVAIAARGVVCGTLHYTQELRGRCCLIARANDDSISRPRHSGF